MQIGVLALQGDYAAHAQVLQRLNILPREIRQAQELATIDGLIIPGGESTTLLKLMDADFFAALQAFGHSGKAILGTCAGAILLAKTVENPAQKSLGLINITIKRNAYGRQLSSKIRNGTWIVDNTHTPLAMAFIRAPAIVRLSAGVKILAHFNDEPVAVIEGNCIAATFHPELTEDLRLHQFFVERVKLSQRT